MWVFFFFFFFFKQKTAYEIVDCDWSSDVCSSDLGSGSGSTRPGATRAARRGGGGAAAPRCARRSRRDRKSVV